MVVIHRSKRQVRHLHDSASIISEAPSPNQPPMFLALEDLKRGVLPHNDQFIIWLETLRSSPALATGGLSPTGQQLMRDLQYLLTLFIRAVKERNQNEVFQSFAYHASLSAATAQRELSRSSKIPVVKGKRQRVYFGGVKDYQLEASRRELREQTKGNAKQLYQTLQMMLTSAEFRDIVVQAQKLLTHLTRQQEQPPTPQQPVTAIEEKRYLTEHTKTFIATSPAPPIGMPAAPFDEELRSLHERISNTHDELQRLRRNEFTTFASAPIATEPFNIAAPTPPPEYKKEAAPSKFDREAFMADFKQLILKVGNGKFKTAIGQMWSILTSMQVGSGTTAATMMDTKHEQVVPTELRYDANFKAAQKDFIAILEMFAGGASLSTILGHMKDLKAMTDQDYELKDFVGDWKGFVNRCLEDPGYMDHEEYRHRSDFLLTRTNDIFKERYRSKFNEAYAAMRAFVDGWSQDELTKEMGAVIRKIIRQDLMGQPEVGDQGTAFLALNLLNPDLVRDFRNIILPNLLHSLAIIPLPRIIAERDDSRLVLENIVLPAESLVPMDLQIKNRSTINMHPKQEFLHKDTSRNAWENGTVIRIGQIRTRISNVKFVIDHLSSFPKFKVPKIMFKLYVGHWIIGLDCRRQGTFDRRQPGSQSYGAPTNPSTLRPGEH